ncbi:hypothetical protein BGZ83_005685 [Gryganskiella cystojenkinii]|nr:hypothetical protein BGZ83_005685 [Gryganskiella cystojenkinii]
MAFALRKRAPKPTSPPHEDHHPPNVDAAAPPVPVIPTPAPKPKPPKPPVTHSSTTEIATTIATTTANSTVTASTISTMDPATTSLSSTSISPSIPSSGSETDGGGASSSKGNTAMIAGIAAGGLVLVLIIAGFLFKVRRKRSREAREAEEAERYQRRSMMQKYSEGSSSYGYGDDAPLTPRLNSRTYSNQQQQERERFHSNRQLQQQPEWFAKKSPLEYQSQVPPLEVLKQQKEQSQPQYQQQRPREQQQVQDQSQNQQRPYPLTQSHSTGSSLSNSSLNAALTTPTILQQSAHAARSLTTTTGGNSSGSNNHSNGMIGGPPAPRGEFIPLVQAPSPTAAATGAMRPYQQHQYQQPRISTQNLGRPSSPAFSSTMSPTSSQSPNGLISPGRNLSPTSSSGSSGVTRTPSIMSNVLQTYTPPPISPSTKPPPGFYDFLEEVDEPPPKPKSKSSHSNMNSRHHSRKPSYGSATPAAAAIAAGKISFTEGEAPMSPPPIPRATRPGSVSSVSSFKLAKVDLKPDPSAPARAEQEWFLTTQVDPNLRDIQEALIDMTIKLPKLPMVKAAIHSQIPITESVVPTTGSSDSTAKTTTAGTASIAATTAETRLGPEASAVTPEQPESKDGEGRLPPTDAQTRTQGNLAVSSSTSVGAQSASVTTTTATATVAQGSVAPVQSNAPPAIANTLQAMHNKTPGHLTQPYFLEQLKDVQNHTAQAIFRLQDYWRIPGVVPTGSTTDAASRLGAGGIKESTRALKTLLELMQRHLRAAIEVMAQPSKEKLYPFRVCDPKIFSPALNEDFVIEFYIRDSQLVCAAYALQLTGGSNPSGGGGLASYLQQALPSSTPTASPIPPSQPTLTSMAPGANTSDTHPSPSMPQLPQAAYGHRTGLSTSSSLNAPPSHSSVGVGNSHGHHGEDGHGAKSGQATPRPSSPVLYHHPSTQQHPQQQSSAGGKSYPWSPTRTPPTGLEHHGASGGGSSSSDSVTLPPSSKIGQTSKGGIKGKIATTIEDKMVQVQSPKLAEISSRLVHAENLCRRLLHFLVLQDQSSTIPSFKFTKTQQAHLQAYMTTFHDQLASTSSFATITTFDLFHYPENDFKEAHRQRAQRIQKNNNRDHRHQTVTAPNSVDYLLRRTTAASSEDQTIRRKVEFRLKNGSNSSFSSDELEHDRKNVSSNKKSNNNGSSNGKHVKQQQQLSHQLVEVDSRSNKRADRRNKISDEEFLQLQQQQGESDEDEDDGYSSGYSSSSSSSSSSHRNRQHHKGQVLEVEERIRFKHNLGFVKGSDENNNKTINKKVDAQTFQKIFEQKLDEKDQIRSNGGGAKHNNNNNNNNSRR